MNTYYYLNNISIINYYYVPINANVNIKYVVGVVLNQPTYLTAKMVGVRLDFFNIIDKYAFSQYLCLK